LAQKCHGDKPPQSHVGLSFGAFQTRLIFSDRGLLNLEEAAVGASFERKLSKTVTVQVNGGGIAYARIGGPTTRKLQGAFGGFGVSWSLRDERGLLPFVMVGASVAASLAVPEQGGDDSLTAFDVRGSVTAGYTFFGRLTPYAVVRAFGGPAVLTEKGHSFVGTDIYHFQIGAGLVLGLPGGFDLSVELVPLGEQRVSAGIGYSF